MKNVGRKSAPIIVTGALLSGMAVVEGREQYHIDPWQYEEPSKLTYEIAVSTATATVLPGSALFPLLSELEGPKFKVKL
jgi:hypothetical protein